MDGQAPDSSAPESTLTSVFDADYLRLHDPLVDGPRSDREAALALTLLEPPVGGRLLDLCCGHGRLANRLAARGYHVDGIDLSPVFLERARADAAAAGVAVDYRLGDAAALPYADASFDGILCWFTSFGLAADAVLQRILAEAARVLKPGARLAIDLANPFYLAMGFQRHAVQEADGRLMIDGHTLDVETLRLWIDRRFIGGGLPERRLRFSLRQFTVPELQGWLLQAGFRAVAVCDGDGAAFTPASPVMIAVAAR